MPVSLSASLCLYLAGLLPYNIGTRLDMCVRSPGFVSFYDLPEKATLEKLSFLTALSRPTRKAGHCDERKGAEL